MNPVVSIWALMLLQCQLVLEELFIHVVVEELVLESAHPQRLELLSTDSLHLGLGQILSCVFINTSHHCV